MNNSNAVKRPDRIGWEVKVCARGHLDYLIEDYFDGMVITNNVDGTTEVAGVLADLPEVYGFIIRLRDAVVFLQSLQVKRTEMESSVHFINQEV